MQNKDAWLLRLANSLVEADLIAKVTNAPPTPYTRRGERCVWVENPRHPGWVARILLREPKSLPQGVRWWHFSWNEQIAPVYDLDKAAHRIAERLTPRPTSLALAEAARLIEGRLIALPGLPADCGWGLQDTC